MIRQIGIGIGMAFVSVVGFALLTIAFLANLLGNVVSAIFSRK